MVVDSLMHINICLDEKKEEVRWSETHFEVSGKMLGAVFCVTVAAALGCLKMQFLLRIQGQMPQVLYTDLLDLLTVGPLPRPLGLYQQYPWLSLGLGYRPHQLQASSLLWLPSRDSQHF